MDLTRSKGAVLELQGLGKSYGTFTAVAALDLTVSRGEIVGLLGPNGAGKTTSLSMIAGVLDPSRGTALVAGRDVVREPREARRQLGFVPQDLALYEDLSARENLSFFARVHGLRGGHRGRQVDWALDFAGLADRADMRVRAFSGGMKRRLNMAAALMHEPALLVLDEPTVGVDAQSRAHIFAQILQLRRERNLAILYTSHYMEEVQALCDRIAIMDGGRVLTEGRLDELVTRHGHGEVLLTIDGDPGPALAALAALGRARAEGKSIVVQTSAALSQIARTLEQAGVRLTAMRTRGADLETVFLELTGHGLRDS